MVAPVHTDHTLYTNLPGVINLAWGESAGHSFRGIPEGYLGEKVFAIGQSSANLLNEI